MSTLIVWKKNNRVTATTNRKKISPNDIIVAEIPKIVFDYYFKLEPKNGRRFISNIYQHFLFTEFKIKKKPFLTEAYIASNIHTVKSFLHPNWWTDIFLEKILS